MSQRAQARIMSMFTERGEQAAPKKLERQRRWKEEWYYDGARIFSGNARADVRDCALYLHRRLHALRSMTDDEIY